MVVQDFILELIDLELNLVLVTLYLLLDKICNFDVS
jgi:hypothetical protein